MIWNIKEAKTTNQNSKKKKMKKSKTKQVQYKEPLGHFKCTNICNIFSEGEEKEEEIGTLFETIMKKKSLIW